MEQRLTAATTAPVLPTSWLTLLGWLLDPLFSFFGGNNGGQPIGVIVGPKRNSLRRRAGRHPELR